MEWPLKTPNKGLGLDLGLRGQGIIWGWNYGAWWSP